MWPLENYVSNRNSALDIIKQIALLGLGSVWSITLMASESETYIEAEHYYYEEPGLMDKESAPLFVNVGTRSYETLENETTALFYNLRLGYGLTDYKGSGTTSGDPTYRLQGEVGLISPHGNIRIFGGFGYRWLYDDWGGKVSSTGAYAYDRQSRYWYLPLGIVVPNSNSGGWRFQYNYFIEGEQTSYLTNVPGYLNDIVNTQDSGSGFEVEYKFDNSWAIYLRSWNIDDSNLQVIRTTSGNGFGYEPKNETVEFGLTVFFD